MKTQIKKQTSSNMAERDLGLSFVLLLHEVHFHVWLKKMDRRELRRLIELYFHLGFENQVILDFLKNRYGITVSLSTLKRRLRD